MKPHQHTYRSEKPDFRASDSVIAPSVKPAANNPFACLLHRRAEEIHARLRLIHARLKTNRERLVFQYIVDNTIGRGKPTDQISNSQFREGKRCSKTGRVIDFGCGLRSMRPIREARKSLVEQGIIIEETVTNEYGTSCPNRYGLDFIRDLVDLRTSRKRCKSLEKHTPRGYYKKHPTYEYPTDINKQRCTTTQKISKKDRRNQQFLQPEHVDYLIDLIEHTTGDSHSRGAFAQTAMTVPEGRIMELLSILKDRDNIKNKGAWFIAVARKYKHRGIINADTTEPSELRAKREKSIPSSVSFKEFLLSRKPEVATLLDMNRKLQLTSVHPKVIEGT